MNESQAMSAPAKLLRRACFTSMAMALTLPTVAFAAPKTRLISCGTQSCLLVKGSRPDIRDTVTINGHAVAVQGGRSWRAILPVDTVRLWSAPYARKISVLVAGDRAAPAEAAQVSLPIGMLGHSEDLAMLVVRAK
ncbi:MAG: hypothetical protein U5M50_01145 [Sphingobium sp.]|nr:hypothetical protein [Sphingobium sp.]